MSSVTTPPFRLAQWATASQSLISFAQNAEDIRLARVFDPLKSGFYVDVGAGDPQDDSVTKFFYDRGWIGINIEPGSSFARLKSERSRDLNLQIAIGSKAEPREFWASATNPGLSTLYPPPPAGLRDGGMLFERGTVACRPLSDVLSEHGDGRHIDFLKIDVEGAEEEVICSIDFELTRPTVLVVEAIAPLTLEPNHTSWDSILVTAGYVFAAFDGVNRFYVPQERQEMIRILAYPISVLDPFRPYRDLLSESDSSGPRAPAGIPAGIENFEVRSRIPRRPSPVVLLYGVASADQLDSSVAALLENTEGSFCLDSLDRSTRARLLSRPGVRDVLVGREKGTDGMSSLCELDFADSLTGVLSFVPGCDVVLLRTGTVVPPGWLDNLEVAAYSDTTCATVSALPAAPEARFSVGSPRSAPASVPPPAIRAPLWGAVYIRRDALNLIELEAGDAAANRFSVDRLEAALDLPGLVHRLACDVIVRDESGGHCALDVAVPAISRAMSIAHAATGKLGVLIDARCFDRPPTGTQVHVLSLIKALGETNELELSVLVPPKLDEGLATSLSELRGVTGFFTIDNLPPRRPSIFHRPYQISSLRELSECKSIASRLVLTHQDMIMERTPSYFASNQEWMNYRLVSALALASADQVGFFSAHAAYDAASEATLESERIHVVALGVDHADISAASAASSLPPKLHSLLSGRPFLLLIGNAYRHKNRLFALRIFNELTKACGWDGTLVLAGGHPAHGCSAPEEKLFLDAHPAIRSKVIDIGSVDEGQKRWLYTEARLVLYPSLYEGFGLVPFEAAACGTPCVYGWRSSLPEYLPIEGAILEGWDARICAESVISILESRDLADELVAAINRAGSRLTWAGTATGYLNVYRQALSGCVFVSSSLDVQVDLDVLEGQPRLIEAELQVLNIYRRRKLFRAVAESTIRVGALATRSGRTIVRTTRGRGESG